MPGYRVKEYTAVVSQTAAGSVTIASAPGAGQKIVVTGMGLVANGACTLKFTSGSDVTGVMSLAANAVVAPNPARIDGADGQAMSLTTVTSFVNGWVNYIIAPA